MNLRYDVFNAERLKGASFVGAYEFPALRGIKLDSIPSRIVGLDKLTARNCDECLVHGYVEDYKYGRIYTRSPKYLMLLKRAKVVIGLDHSAYRDLPLTEQIHSMYLNRATDYWWQQEGVRVIPNISCADERSYAFCCDGIERGTTIAMSSFGHKRRDLDKRYFIEGVRVVIQKLSPHSILLHGAIPTEVQAIADYYHVQIIHIPTRLELAHSGKAA